MEFGAKEGDDFLESGWGETFEVVELELFEPVFHAGVAFEGGGTVEELGGADLQTVRLEDGCVLAD